jgi:hypothetical protein
VQYALGRERSDIREASSSANEAERELDHTVNHQCGRNGAEQEQRKRTVSA